MWEVELIVIRVQGGEKVETLIKRTVWFRVRFIDLVEHHDGAQAKRERFGRHEFGLRHRAFGRVHQEDHTINHGEDAFHLAAKVGVTRRIHDVDTVTFPFHGGRFGENGDPALTFQIVAIHGAFVHGLVLTERTGLFEQFVNQGGFPVVNVGDDGDIAQIHVRSLKLLGARIARAGSKDQCELGQGLHILPQLLPQRGD